MISETLVKPRFTNWIEQRKAELDEALRWLRAQGILVFVINREAPLREYKVPGVGHRLVDSELIDHANRLKRRMARREARETSEADHASA